LGATVLVIGTVQFFLALTHRLPERAPVGLRVVPDLVGAGGGQAAPAASAPSAAETTAGFRR
ncbi:MAG: hypothetical protein M0010_02415, partial [Actinomycetota bacterium]|nr:hypothetical protein [Actinomycetota bacterium]